MLSVAKCSRISLTSVDKCPNIIVSLLQSHLKRDGFAVVRQVIVFTLMNMSHCYFCVTVSHQKLQKTLPTMLLADIHQAAA